MFTTLLIAINILTYASMATEAGYDALRDPKQALLPFTLYAGTLIAALACYKVGI